MLSLFRTPGMRFHECLMCLGAHPPNHPKACTLAAVVHTIFHVCFLKFVLPFCAVRSRDNAKLEGITYKDCATFLPATWFNTNPVHCLRSKYVYEHNPPCDFYRCGREEFMRASHGRDPGGGRREVSLGGQSGWGVRRSASQNGHGKPPLACPYVRAVLLK